MNKFILLLFDLFLIIGSIVGVGFATGKEISHFFIGGKSIVFAVIIFLLVFTGLCWHFLNIKTKYNIRTLNQLNKLAFGKYAEVGNMLLIILFVVTSSAMLAGCDNLVRNYLNCNIPIVSIILSVITFFVVIGGIKRIKIVANILVPVLVVIIIANACLNINDGYAFQGVSILDFCYPIIFCCENFVTLISVLLSTKSKPKQLSIISGVVISILVLLSALAISGLNADMPMLSLSQGVSKAFFIIYLLGVIFALFTTLEISTYHCLHLCLKRSKDKFFVLGVILLISQIIAYLGFNFIVKYLYTGIGIISAIYLIVLIIKLIKIKK